jgi:hypothetical protein
MSSGGAVASGHEMTVDSGQHLLEDTFTAQPVASISSSLVAGHPRCEMDAMVPT